MIDCKYPRQRLSIFDLSCLVFKVLSSITLISATLWSGFILLDLPAADRGRRARSSPRPRFFWCKSLSLIPFPLFPSPEVICGTPAAEYPGWTNAKFAHGACLPSWCSITHEWRERCRGWRRSAIDGGTTTWRGEDLITCADSLARQPTLNRLSKCRSSY